MTESGGFRVEVVSPERVLFSGDATQVIVVSSTDFGVYAQLGMGSTLSNTAVHDFA